MAADLDKILHVAQEAALQAGAKIREAISSQRDDVQLTTKSSTTDLVTETDHQCECLRLWSGGDLEPGWWWWKKEEREVPKVDMALVSIDDS